MSEVVEVVVTGPKGWVQPFVDALLADRIVACAHLVDITSTYRWDGRVEHDDEVRAMLHTTPGRLAELEARIEQDHPYDVPCILTVALAASVAYAEWVRESTT